MSHHGGKGGHKEAEARTAFASFVLKIKATPRLTLALTVSIVLAVILMVLVVVFIVRGTSSDDGSFVVPETVYRHPLTGTRLETELTALPQVMAVMVENSADAWPLVGLDQAFMVIEAPVEGMIPRCELFFAADQPNVEKIGPVRSARPYYIDWAAQFGALYGHVGGSPEALDKLVGANVYDLNEFYQGEYYYRDNATRYAPHNVYTTLNDLVDAATNELVLSTPSYAFWKFKDDAPSGLEQAVAIDWTGGSTYDVDWRYDVATNTYERHQGGTSYFLEQHAPALANNVVIMESDVTVVPGDDKGRRHIRTTGTGSAMILQDGTLIVGTWRKDTESGPLKFFTDAGDEVSMNAGKTWIEVVPSLGQATVTTEEVLAE